MHTIDIQVKARSMQMERIREVLSDSFVNVYRYVQDADDHKNSTKCGSTQPFQLYTQNMPFICTGLIFLSLAIKSKKKKKKCCVCESHMS